MNLDIKRVVGYRQFCNKIWNAFRFAMLYISDFFPYLGMQNHVTISPKVAKRDLFILSKLNTCIKDCIAAIDSYLFGAATSALHSFFLYDVCDYYLEVVKPLMNDNSEEKKDEKRIAQATLFIVLESFLRLAHPMMPFVTEELWQRLPNRTNMTEVQSIAIAAYPKPIDEWFNPAVEHSNELIQEAIHGARSLRSDYKIANHVKANFYFQTTSEEIRAAFTEQAEDFCTLAKGNCFTNFESGQALPKGWCVKVLNDQLSLLVDLTGIIDIDTEIARLAKEVERLNPLVDSYRRKINVAGYDKVPEAVKVSNSEKLAAYEAELDATVKAIETFQGMK